MIFNSIVESPAKSKSQKRLLNFIKFIHGNEYTPMLNHYLNNHIYIIYG